MRGVGMFEQAQAGGGEAAIEIVAQLGVDQDLAHGAVLARQPALGQQPRDQGCDGVTHAVWVFRFFGLSCLSCLSGLRVATGMAGVGADCGSNWPRLI